LKEHGHSLAEINRQLGIVYKVDTSFIDNAEDLLSPESLETRQRQVQEELSEVRSKYQQELDEAIKAHHETTFENDEKTREILDFISSIGFDLIPKEYTDRLISEVKSGLIVINSFTVNPQNLDLKNGRF